MIKFQLKFTREDFGYESKETSIIFDVFEVKKQNGTLFIFSIKVNINNSKAWFLAWRRGG